MSAGARQHQEHFVAAEDVLASSFDNEVVLLNLKDGVYYGLDDVGVVVWTLLRQPVTVTEIRDRVAADYDVDPVRCERDVRSLLKELVHHGLVCQHEET